MKILLTGDKHIRYQAPENRIDDFFETQINKEREMLEIASDTGCECILQPGDFFDNPNPPRYVLSRYIELYNEFKLPIYTVMGQHDTSMRNLDQTVMRTATYLLQSAGVVKIVGLDKLPVMLDANTTLYGISFDQEYEPKPQEEGFNILMAHASVGDKPLYPGHVLPGPRDYARKHGGFSLILLGDYHYPYEDSWQGCDIINCGVSIRKTVDKRELELKPKVIVYDTEKHSHEIHYLQIRPWGEVFQIVEKPADTNRIMEFIESLKYNSGNSMSFASNLRLFYQNNVVRPEVKDIIAQAMEQVQMPREELQLC